MVMKISEGAEADIYLVDLLGIKCIMKYRRKKNYMPAALDESLSLRRTRSEAKAMIAARRAGVAVPSILLVSKYSIFMEKIDGTVLYELDEKLPRSVLKDSGKILAKLHNSDIAHGDFTKANLMIGDNGSLYAIDFGLSAQTDSVEEKALDLLLLKRSLGEGFETALDSYKRVALSGSAVLRKLEDIETRGRYQERSLVTAKE
jgi:Kae1-associated kinase Bud32